MANQPINFNNKLIEHNIAYISLIKECKLVITG